MYSKNEKRRQIEPHPQPIDQWAAHSIGTQDKWDFYWDIRARSLISCISIWNQSNLHNVQKHTRTQLPQARAYCCSLCVSYQLVTLLMIVIYSHIYGVGWLGIGLATECGERELGKNAGKREKDRSGCNWFEIKGARLCLTLGDTVKCGHPLNWICGVTEKCSDQGHFCCWIIEVFMCTKSSWFCSDFSHTFNKIGTNRLYRQMCETFKVVPNWRRIRTTQRQTAFTQIGPN